MDAKLRELKVQKDMKMVSLLTLCSTDELREMARMLGVCVYEPEDAPEWELHSFWIVLMESELSALRGDAEMKKAVESGASEEEVREKLSHKGSGVLQRMIEIAGLEVYNLYEENRADAIQRLAQSYESVSDGERKLKLRVMKAHRKLVREGEYDVAQGVLEFLMRGKLTLGFSDVSMSVEDVLTNVGCKVVYTYPHYMAEVYLKLDSRYEWNQEQGYAKPEQYMFESEGRQFPSAEEEKKAKPDAPEVISQDELQKEEECECKTGMHEERPIAEATPLEQSISQTQEEVGTPGSTLVDVCAGVENYESGKLTEEELSEVLKTATAETLREYILDVIVPDKGRKDAA